jgi:phosphoribosyl 1,2-cyclic phosphate phosphodiesterase
MRASIYIEGNGGEHIVIDTGPEFRLQALAAGITSLDAVFLTHAHADHVHGLDDIRALSWRHEIPVYGNAHTMNEVRERFSYVFRETQKGGGKPHISLNPLKTELRLGCLTIRPVPVKHGCLDILGFVIREDSENGQHEAAYLTDVSAIPPSSMNLLTKEGGPDLLIIDGLRETPHETHFSFEQALSAGIAIKARQIYLTHICHNNTHAEIEAICAAFAKKQGAEAVPMHPAWDGLELEV